MFGSWCRNSATIAWARLKMGIGGLGVAAVTVAQAADADSVKHAIEGACNVMGKPLYFFIFVGVIGFVTECARARTLPR